MHPPYYLPYPQKVRLSAKTVNPPWTPAQVMLDEQFFADQLDTQSMTLSSPHIIWPGLHRHENFPKLPEQTLPTLPVPGDWHNPEDEDLLAMIAVYIRDLLTQGICYWHVDLTDSPYPTSALLRSLRAAEAHFPIHIFIGLAAQKASLLPSDQQAEFDWFSTSVPDQNIIHTHPKTNLEISHSDWQHPLADKADMLTVSLTDLSMENIADCCQILNRSPAFCLNYANDITETQFALLHFMERHLRDDLFYSACFENYFALSGKVPNTPLFSARKSADLVLSSAQSLAQLLYLRPLQGLIVKGITALPLQHITVMPPL